MLPVVDQLWRHFAYAEARTENADGLFAELVKTAPVVRFDRFWILSQYSHVTAIANNPGFVMPKPEFPTNVREENPGFVEFFGNSLSVRPQPEHRHLRSVLTREFTGRSLQRLRPRIEKIVDDLFTEPRERGELEFIREIAIPLPVMTTAALLGLPEADWPQISVWAKGMIATIGASFPGVSSDGATPITGAGFTALRSYVDDIVEQRAGGTGEDLVSRLNAARNAGKLSRTELVDMILLLFMTGVDTVTSALANTLFCLLSTPGAWTRLVSEPDLAGIAFAEAIRLLTPVTFGSRVATEDIDVAGLHFDAGDTLLLSYAAANLDPKQFDNPLEFRWDRPVSGNVAFGHGMYYCLGAALGTLEAEVVLRALTKYSPELTLATTTPRWRAELTFNSPAELPLLLDARCGALG